jgi:ribosomal protein S18 acetylase RimI-like enzyme
VPPDDGIYRSAQQSDLRMLQSELDEESWSCLSRLLRFFCTKQEWIFLWLEAEKIAGALALAAPSDSHQPLEIVWLLGGFGKPAVPLRLCQLAVQKAKALGTRELYCTLPENCAAAAVISEAQFCPWRKIMRFESGGPIALGGGGYRSVPVDNFPRSEIIELIEKTSQNSADSQIKLYRQQLGGIADAELTLGMMESLSHEPLWWRVALAPKGEPLGIVLPVWAFGEMVIGFIGVVPENRGRNIASFLLFEAWSVIRLQGHSTICAEADEQSVPMHRALEKSQFSRRSQKQEWRLELRTRRCEGGHGGEFLTTKTQRTRSFGKNLKRMFGSVLNFQILFSP